MRLLLLTLSLIGGAATAAVIGQNPPAPPLSAERVAALPQPEREAWQRYLARSQAQGAADRAALAAERQGLSSVPPPPEGGKASAMPLREAPGWYGAPVALQVADNILSFQTPAGGWGKNQPRDRAPRLRGQDYVTVNVAPARATAGDFDLAADEKWSYVGTIDNDATITEIRFLSRVAAAKPAAEASYRLAALRGISYLLDAQFPNGGWPQVWPLQGGYHDAVTLNDNAMVEVAELLGAVARGQEDFGFVPAALRERAAAAEQRALKLMLAAQQSTADGRKSIWAQQYDALTLAPASARNYEPPALCTGESTELLMYLMSLPAPSAEVKAAVHGGIKALRALAFHDKAWVTVDEVQGRRLLDKPGAGPLWARYYDPLTLKPVYGDRDKSLHDDVNEISFERRKGYAWIGTWPLKALKAYEGWAQRWGSDK